jgi:tetratricopeptide (TPR) repeat protein
MVTPVQAKLNEAHLAFQARDYQQATNLLEKQLEGNEKNVVAHLFMAKIGVKTDELDLAEKHIKFAEELIRGKESKIFEMKIQAEVFYWFGVIMEMQAEKASIFSMSGYAKKSLKGYLKAVKLSSKNLEYRKGLINFYLGAPSLLGGDIDKAINHAQIAFEQEPNFGYKMLANCYAKNGDIQLLLATYKVAIETFPSDAEFLFMRGSYWKGERDYEKAVADYQRALKLPGSSIEHKSIQLISWYWIGRISGFNGTNLSRGINAYQQVVDFNEDIGDYFMPSKEWTQFRMAKLMVLNGQNKEAEAIFTKLLNSSQHKELKEEVLPELDKLSD